MPPRLNVSAALAGSRVTVSPEPGLARRVGLDADQHARAAVGELSRSPSSARDSGAHAGRLRAYSQGDGASFVADRPFTQGERVTVHGELREGRQTIPFAWGFTVAVQDHGGAAGGSPRPAPQQAAYQSFRSRPDLRPPTVTVTAHSPSTHAG